MWSKDHAANGVGKRMIRAEAIVAIAIVFVMVASSFFTMTAKADETAIWTSKDEYLAGQTVEIFGQGWVEFAPVQLVLSHPDFEEDKLYEVIPDLYGRFVSRDYVSEYVINQDTPVTVTATQTYDGSTRTATTQFWDPGATILMWNLKPNMRWQKGDIKGYNEGDSIPSRVDISYEGADVVTFTIGLDFVDLNGPNPIYGIDFLTEYWDLTPEPPYNIYTSSDTPFYVDPAQGTLLSQERLADQYDSGTHQAIQVWQFVLDFADGADEAIVRFGAHMALSNEAIGYYGASYYPGSALHARIVLIEPDVYNEGNRDVPITLGQQYMLQPPEMNLEKSCTPYEVVEDQEITFTVHFWNTGQADAWCVELWDDLQMGVVDITEGSFLYWDTFDMTPRSFSPGTGPVIDGAGDWTWYYGTMRGRGADDAKPVFHAWLQFTATVITSEEGMYWNYVWLTHTDDHGGYYDTLEARCPFVIRGQPDIQIVKDGPAYAHVGETITYTYAVTNIGYVPLVDVDVTDNKAGLIAQDVTLAVGETKYFSKTYTVLGSDPDPLVNVATAIGRDSYGRTATDDDDHVVDILHPMIDVTKWADKECAEIGEDVQYVITISNPSPDTTLYDVVVDDSMFGVVWTGTLLPGQSETVGILYEVKAGDPDPLWNYVYADGWDIGDWYVWDDDEWSVEILHPMIEITKTADKTCAEATEVVTYWINVYNPSRDTVMYAEVYDPLLGLGMLWSGLLQPMTGQDLGPYEYTVPFGVEWVDNTAYVWAWDYQNHIRYAESSWSVEILYPAIEVTKTSLWTCAAEGERVTYTITVTNVGDTMLVEGWVYDPYVGFYVEFEDLDVGQSLSWTPSMLMPNEDPFINTVYAFGYDRQGHERSDYAQWAIDLRHPMIDVEKTADVGNCAAIGDTIIYTITVYNPSPDTVMYYTVSDPLLGWSASGDLVPGETDTYLIPYIVTDQTPDWLVNTVSVYAWDDQWDENGEYWLHEAYDSDEWRIDILHAMIDVEKTADVGNCAAIGDTIVYTIVVSNPSLDTSMNYIVQDLQLGWVASGYLAPGASAVYYVGYVVSEDTPDPFINEAHVYAWDDQYFTSGDDWENHDAEDWDSWWIDIYHPMIDVEKWADVGNCAAIGDTITYTIVVSNPSPDTWMNYDVYDAQLGWGASGRLEPGDSDTYYVSMLVTVDTPDNFVNWVYVFGYDDQYYTSNDQLNHFWEDWDSWWIDILHPMIDVEKWADVGNCAAVGDTIIYTIVVSNPSPDTWMSYYVYDDVLAWDESGYLAPGTSDVFYVPYLVTELTPDPLENWVYVSAWDDQYWTSDEWWNHYVTDWDYWLIDILHPMIDVQKTAEVGEGDNCAGIGDWITYTVVVYNPSPDTPVTYFAYDSMQGFLGSAYLLPGEFVVYFYQVQVTDQTPDPLINLAWVDAYDDQYLTSDEWWNHYAYDEDSWYIDIVHPAIDLEKSVDAAYAHIGDVLNYEITVTNIGDIELSGTITDMVLGINVPFSGLMPGDVIPLYGTYTVLEGDDWVYNEAWVMAVDLQGHPVTDWDWTLVEVIVPDIDVEKTGPEYASVGETITYTVVVTNTGDTPLYYVYVWDSFFDVWIAYYDMLDVGETHTLTYDVMVPPGEGPLVNTVWAWGYDILWGYVDDWDQWTVLKYSTVEGYKFADLDRDGIRDMDEPGIVNWLITLEGPMPTQTRLTGADGSFLFTMLVPGDYVLTEQMLTGWTPTTPTSALLSLAGGSAAAVDFGNVPEGCITGYKWNDRDMDGLWDDNELGIPGWMVYLDGLNANGDEVHLSMATLDDGSYAFCGLLPGVYTVTEEIKPGWIPTTSMIVPVDRSAIEPFEVVVNFGNVRTGSITGYKWLDEHMNGVFEPPFEHGLEGWKITLTGVQDDGTVVGPIVTYTDANGYYHFDNLLPGTYTVTEEVPPGWIHITPDSWTFTVIDGVIQCGSFGNVQPSKIWGWKFLDWDMDGAKDDNEPGIPGWEITLEGYLNDGLGWYSWAAPGATHVGPITTHTDANGYWEFIVLPGVYIVSEELRENWYATTDTYKYLIVGSGTEIPRIKFGNVPLTCLWGYKWNDLNGNGIREDGEPGIPGWTIVVEGWRNDGVYVYIELTTDQDGMWITCFNILPGQYWVHEVMQDDWMPITPDWYYVDLTMPFEPARLQIDFGNFRWGKIHGWKFHDLDGDGVKDPEDTPIAGWVVYIDLPWGGTGWTWTDENGYFEFTGLPWGEYTVYEIVSWPWYATSPTSYTVDIVSGVIIELDPFLNTMYGCIYGYKFEDIDGDGVWDDGEPGIPGWNIYMMYNGDPTIYQRVTDEYGYYEFCNLVPDEYYMVWEEERDGWTPTTPVYEVLSLEPGEYARVHDFGNFKCVDIVIFKFEDVDSDGFYDEGIDRPIEGWNMEITKPSGEVVVVQTNELGIATYTACEAGRWWIWEEEREGWCHTTWWNGWNVWVESGYVEYFEESTLPYDVIPGMVWFPNFKCVDIVIFKFEDVNSDGFYDEGLDRPIEGWNMEIIKPSGEVVVVQTNESGIATYTACEAGWWSIWEEEREGWSHTTWWNGWYVWVESDYVDYFEESTLPYDVIPGMAWFPNFECVDVWIFKYWDTCSNGWYDPQTDYPLPEWFFDVIGLDVQFYEYGWTDGTGWLHFKLCSAGTYLVTEGWYEDWIPINPAEGYLLITVQSGDEPYYLYFGNYRIVDVPIFKYEDVNSNGIYDDGDHPINGWYFEMVGHSQGYVYSGYTGEDGDGLLILEVSRSDMYTITEADYLGWTHVNPADGTRLISVTSDVVVPVQMFGNFENQWLCGFKFDDIYADGQYSPDQGDVPISGWLMSLWVWDDDLGWIWLEDKLTNEYGYACFEITSAGVYAISEEWRDGWWWISPPSGYWTAWVDSDSGRQVLEFANFKLGKISGYKWNDIDGDGVWDEGEPALPGWTITFAAREFYFTGSDVTDENGYYEFTGLVPATYDVYETPQQGWVPTTPPSVMVSVIGHTEARVDFGNFELGCIYGYKFEDMDGDGVKDPEDTPVQGWTIYLSQTTGVIETPQGPISAIWLVAITTTDENGLYYFCGLGPGIYIVDEESRTGWTHTTDPSETIVLTSGAEVRIHDFLNFELGCICGAKFEDTNSNGIWDDGEDGIGGWPIFAIWNGMVDPILFYTMPDGSFCLSGLYADTYLIYEGLVGGYTPTTPTWYIVPLYSGDCVALYPFGNFRDVWVPIFKYEDVNGNGLYDNGDMPLEDWMFEVTGPGIADPLVLYTDEFGWTGFWATAAGTYTVDEEEVLGWMHTTPDPAYVTVESGDWVETLMFGNAMLVDITGYKFYDWDRDGMREMGEQGLSNWVVWIEGFLPDGSYAFYTRLTDSNGFFSVEGLPPGIYVVSERIELAPPGWMPTTPIVQVLVLESGVSPEAVMFGNVVLGKIYGYKFYDKNLDGWMDLDEPGLSGWTITLDGMTDGGQEVHLTTLTDAAGYYEFPEVQPGTYEVNEVLPGGYYPTTPLPVTVDVSGSMVYFTVRVDIGNVRYAKVYGWKFLDTYSQSWPFWPNGQWDWYESGLGNWEITLEGWTTEGDRVELVAYTDNMFNIGYYEFTDLLPGTYWVNETLLWGYYATRPISNLIMIPPFPNGQVEFVIMFGNLLPSPDPEINFVLEKGANLWSSPLVNTGVNRASDLVAEIGPTCTKISMFDTATGKYKSFIPAIHKAGSANDFAISSGKGYFVYVTSETTFTLIGELPASTSVALAKGVNIVGYNSLMTTTASDLAKMSSGCKITKISYLDPVTKKYKSFIPAIHKAGSTADFTITQGRAYFVWSDAAGSLVVT